MWLVWVRQPRPDAPYWRGRRLLGGIDAVVWPYLLVLAIRNAPAPVGLVGPVLATVMVLNAAVRLHRALWMNHRYEFTTWRLARFAIVLAAAGAVLKVAMLV